MLIRRTALIIGVILVTGGPALAQASAGPFGLEQAVFAQRLSLMNGAAPDVIVGALTSDPERLSVTSYYRTVERRPSVVGPVRIVARRFSGGAIELANADTCPGLHDAYNLLSGLEGRIDLYGRAQQPPSLDGTIYFIWVRSGVQAGGDNAAFGIRSNTGWVASWGNLASKVLQPCWTIQGR